MSMVPQEAPARNGLPFGARFSYYLGHGNDMAFNGGSERGIEVSACTQRCLCFRLRLSFLFFLELCAIHPDSL